MDCYKEIIRQRSLWRKYRQSRLEKEYLQNADYYHTKLREGGKTYSEKDTITRIKASLPRKDKKVGEIHTYAIVPGYSWHWALFPHLKCLGKVTRFDWLEHGLNWFADVGRNHKKWVALREVVNKKLLCHLSQVNLRSPVDWIFIYTEGRHLLKDTLKAIRQDIGIPIVMMCLDDKQSWRGLMLGEQRDGQVDLIPEIDLYWTSARECCKWIFAEGGNPIFMPEGCDGDVFCPLDVKKENDLVFIGGAYGFRKHFIKRLNNFGILVKTFGPGWGKHNGSVWGDAMVRALNSGWINLGHGGIGYSEHFLNVKTRDFEAPVVGTATYLTSYNPDLNKCFNIGEEIYCFRSDIDFLEQVNYLLSHKEKIVESAQKARERCLREHQWFHRYIRILNILNILKEPVVNKSYYQ